MSYGKPGITLRAFAYLPSRLRAGEDLTGVTIKGEVQLEVHRAYVSGSIPVNQALSSLGHANITRSREFRYRREARVEVDLGLIRFICLPIPQEVSF